MTDETIDSGNGDSSGQGQTDLPSGTEPQGTVAPRTLRDRIRLFVLRGAAVFGAFMLLGALFGGLSAVYTSRPEFCRSCHNMEPYYVSWQESSHSHVSCVKCHFPPGVGEKIHGKLLGLVQLAKYVTSTAGPRPAAEVPDASCLRSGCHETRLLAGKVEFNGVLFDHTPHLHGVRLGKELRCTSCHSQIVQGSHMKVTTSSCFLCHFKDQHFNQGLGTCTRCHQIPTEVFDLGDGTTFDHNLCYERGVECDSCHGDLIRGKGEVPTERCTVCHNRTHDLERIGDREFLHQKHVADHKVDCLECHLEIHHSGDPHRIENSASDCTACHPDQHRQQINMFQGIGAETASPTPNQMVKTRITCVSCHKSKQGTSKGNVLWAASAETCADGHDLSAVDRLWSAHESLKASLDDLETCIANLREKLKGDDMNSPRSLEIVIQLGDIDKDLKFLRVANGIHNIHYASTLTRGLQQQVSTLCQELGVVPPASTAVDTTGILEGERS